LKKIDSDSPFDAASGARLEQDAYGASGLVASQKTLFRTQSVYLENLTPYGDYSYFVDMIQQNGIADEWKLEVRELRKLVFNKTGTGYSEKFIHSAFECKYKINCNSNQVCTSGRCLVDGTPRFTLTWTGDDDLDLSVAAPRGKRISLTQKKR
jgi:hypothetical protein